MASPCTQILFYVVVPLNHEPWVLNSRRIRFVGANPKISPHLPQRKSILIIVQPVRKTREHCGKDLMSRETQALAPIYSNLPTIQLPPKLMIQILIKWKWRWNTTHPRQLQKTSKLRKTVQNHLPLSRNQLQESYVPGVRPMQLRSNRLLPHQMSSPPPSLAPLAPIYRAIIIIIGTVPQGNRN